LPGPLSSPTVPDHNTPDHLVPDHSEPEPTPIQKILLVMGSAALLTAMAADALAVLGRHTGFTLPGSIEVFQVAAVVALSCAILIASLNNRHAAVDLLIGKASHETRHVLQVIGYCALALAFALLCAGSIWVAVDLWSTHEITEQLEIPLRPFRLFWIVCSGTIAVYYITKAFRAVRR
jgi:TRAP-type C4-dicarboxylate transport system permease small subunit